MSQQSNNPDMQSLLNKYKSRLNSVLNPSDDEMPSLDSISHEYEQFKDQYVSKQIGWYEKLCNYAKVMGTKPDDKREKAYRDAIETCHLNTTPEGMFGLALLSPLFVIVFFGLFSFAITQSTFMIMISLVLAVGVMYFFMHYPIQLATRWKMKAGNETVISVFYIVTFMRHTSNLELAINFASNHLSGLLALDFKKILWDVENQRYGTIQDSMENYLNRWTEWNPDFVEAIHLIESSLYETEETRRVELLDKSLKVILDGSYERMLHYARELKGPITMLHMLGIILPILGLVILPLIVSFMQGSVQWYHISSLYNILIPLGVYYIGTQILEKRPNSYGDTEISKDNPEYKAMLAKQRLPFGLNPKYLAAFIIILGTLIGLSPVLLHTMNPSFDVKLSENENLLDYREIEYDGVTEVVGPFSIYATVIAVLIPLAVGLGIGIYYRIISGNVISIRTRTKKLEDEFGSALFQLGNRLGDGLPAEIAFSKVGEGLKGSKASDFFNTVTTNVMSRGMNLGSAIFDSRIGAMVKYPSNVIQSSMKVLLQSIKKGPKIAATAMMSIATYLKEIKRVDDRLQDLLDEVSSSIKSQIKFIAPLIAGIVIGLSSMVTTILAKLQSQMTSLQGTGTSTANVSTLSSILNAGLPAYYIQCIVGLYIVEIIFVLTLLLNGIEKGVDKINRNHLLGFNMIKGVITFTIVSVILVVMFNMITLSIMGPGGIGSVVG